MERKSVVVLSLFLSVLVLLELVGSVGFAVSGTGSTTTDPQVRYNVTVFQRTLVLYNDMLFNGYHSNPNNYEWSLTSAVYDPVNGFVYATNSLANTVVVLNPKNYSVIGTITVGQTPVWITINPENGYLYVVNQGTSTISVVDPSTNKVVNTIYVGNYPKMAVYNPSNGYLYVVNSLNHGNCAVQLVDNQGVVKSIPIPFGVYPINDIAYDPVTHYVVLGTIYGVYAISGDKIIANNTNCDFNGTYIGNKVETLAIDPSNGYIYGVTYSAVVVYSPYNLSITYAVPFKIPLMTINAAVYVNGTVYVLLSGYTHCYVYAVNVAKNSSSQLLSVTEFSLTTASHSVVYADSDLVLALTTPTPFYIINLENGESIGVGVNVEDSAVIYNPVTGYVYATNQNSNTLYVINPSTGKVVNMLPSIPEPFAITYNPKNGYLYVASYINNTVAEVNPYNGQVVWSVVAGKEPNAVLYNTYNNMLYVEYYGTSTVAVINPNTGEIVGEAQVGSEPVYMTFDPSTGLVYVANEGSNSITVINGTQVVGTINLGFTPTTLAFINGSLYIGGVINEQLFYSSPHISIYREGKIVANISLNTCPTDIQYYNGLIYVTAYGYSSSEPGYLVVINDTHVLKYVNVGICPTSIAITPNGTIYVANEAEGTISEISVSVKPLATTTTTTSTIAVTTTSTTMTSTTSTTTTVTTTTKTMTMTTPPTSMLSSSAPPTASTSSLPVSPGLLIVIALVVIVIVIAVVFLLKR